MKKITLKGATKMKMCNVLTEANMQDKHFSCCGQKCYYYYYKN
ncbi:hypothetical protein HMPREF9092_1573 [Eubacterium sulci ATCC 35585]|nr:hypothetical protein HMPREF9092_1573 [Eubacterium sulci ATCC 35585]